MGRLHDRRLEPGDVDAALRELDLIQRELAAFPPSEVVWDKDMFEVLRTAIREIGRTRQPGTIE
jgi:hypothetical protein